MTSAALPVPSGIVVGGLTRNVLVRRPRDETQVRRAWLTGIAVSNVVGLGLIAAADLASRHGWAYTRASTYFWIGVMLVFAPTAVRALMPETSRNERLALVLLLGLALYMVKIFASPHAFTFSDEYVHVRSTQDILSTHHLFAFNPLLPTASYYPGLPALTAGLVSLTGMSTFASGLIVIAVARVLLIACLFLLAQRLTGSGRGAATATLVYVGNPMFLFWSSVFAYENLALPLAAFVVWWLNRIRRGVGAPVLAGVAVAIAAVVVTHHVAGFALAALLGGWWVVERRRADVVGARTAVGAAALGTAVATSLWFFAVARPAAHYLLTNNVVVPLRQTAEWLTGQRAGRHLYASAGLKSPAWEPLAGLFATALLCVGLVFAIRLAWRRRRYAPLVAAGVVAVSYPFTLLPRFAPDGVAISGRSSEFVYFGLACVLGLLVLEVPWHRVGRHRRRIPPQMSSSTWSAVLAALATVVFVGNITVGTPFYQRLPEASTPHGYPWSMQPEVVAAATWTRTHLGTKLSFAANKDDARALATYGDQNPVAEQQAWPIFFEPKVDPAVVQRIRAQHIRYLFVNSEMTRGVPTSPGDYFSPQEPGAGEYKRVFPAAALTKFTSAKCMRRVYTHGAIQIFDVSSIEDGKCKPAGVA